MADAPNEGMYMLCGVFIAMVLVALIIILLAVTIRFLYIFSIEASKTFADNYSSFLNFGKLWLN
uniref:Uncharacterized protein n=1 Tax=Rhodnius prolixus TaxID=13249 RepID=T1I8K6_RHOPR